MATPGKSRFHHGDLRRALLDAAGELVNREGVAALSLRRVAQAAGVSHAAPYHHFSDKSALLAALAEAGFVALAEATAKAADAAGSDPFERLAGLGAGYIRFATANPGWFRLMFRPEMARPQDNPCVDAAGQSAFAQLRKAVDACLKHGARDERQAADYVLSAWSTVHGAAALWLDGPLSRRAQGSSSAAEQLADQVAGVWVSMFRNELAACP